MRALSLTALFALLIAGGLIAAVLAFRIPGDAAMLVLLIYCVGIAPSLALGARVLRLPAVRRKSAAPADPSPQRPN